MEFELPPTPSPQQQAVDDFVAGGKGDLVVDATAGSGKTSTLLMALKRCPQRSVLFLAFNKPIATELETKIAKQGVRPGWAVHVKTFHALGLSILRKHFPGKQIADRGAATDQLIHAAADGRPVSFAARRAASKLLRTVKEAYHMSADKAPTMEALTKIALDHNIFGPKVSPDDAARACQLVRDAYLPGLDFARRPSIDFCDMVWGVVALKLAPASRYHAVFVDELQDASGPQLALVRMVQAPGGRLIAVGDVHQQLYEFRGSLGKQAWSMLREAGAKQLPLSVSFRCSRAVITQAQEIVKTIEARPNAPEGSVTRIPLVDAARTIMPRNVESSPGYFHTFVLSRNNAALLDLALKLWVAGARFQLRFDEGILEPLYELLEKLDLRGPAQFTKSLNAWLFEAITKAEAQGSTEAADRAEDMAAMLEAVAQYRKPTEIKYTLGSILKPNDSGVLLSTVHKAKGLEADRVFLLRWTFARHAPDKPCRYCRGLGGFDGGPADCRVCHGSGLVTAKLTESDLNIEFVAITRARFDLIWVLDGTEVAKVDAPPTGPTGPEVELGAQPSKVFDLSDAGLAKLTTAELHVLLKRLEAAEEVDQPAQEIAGVPPDVRLDQLLRIRKLIDLRAELY